MAGESLEDPPIWFHLVGLSKPDPNDLRLWGYKMGVEFSGQPCKISKAPYFLSSFQQCGASKNQLIEPHDPKLIWKKK